MMIVAALLFVLDSSFGGGMQRCYYSSLSKSHKSIGNLLGFFFPCLPLLNNLNSPPPPLLFKPRNRENPQTGNPTSDSSSVVDVSSNHNDLIHPPPARTLDLDLNLPLLQENASPSSWPFYHRIEQLIGLNPPTGTKPSRKPRPLPKYWDGKVDMQ
ncbi:hypothetical protein LINPERPRIM_LOCUS3482 [Linum perenne]